MITSSSTASHSLADRERLLAVCGGNNIEIFCRQLRFDEPQVRRHVIHNQHAGAHR